jgi:hypothetical protein
MLNVFSLAKRLPDLRKPRRRAKLRRQAATVRPAVEHLLFARASLAPILLRSAPGP